MTTDHLSRKIQFEGLNNTRDLGGMRTKQGKHIVPGKLIRSGHLHGASKEDVRELSDKIALIVDFRTMYEFLERNDPAIDGVNIVHLPVFESFVAGVTREEKSDAEAFTMVFRAPQIARQYMVNTYLGFVTNDFSISQYSRFVRLLLEPREKAVLWHCTVGKDRAGFASVIVQELLGVDRNDIFADYLQTNVYLTAENNRLRKMVEQKMGDLDDASAQALDFLFGAHEEYLAGIYEKVDEIYGSFSSFLTDKMHISHAETDRLRELYLAD